MNVAISGAGGLVGRELCALLAQKGHGVRRLVRGNATTAEDMPWSVDSGLLEPGGADGLDGVVHLAGENIAARRWSADQKRRIRDSRVLGTRNLAASLASLPHPPGVLVCASAIGWYGERGNAILNEQSGSGDGFLAEVCRDWEAAAEPARAAGLRVVHLRLGVVLDAQDGALARMLKPFRLGVGGRVGSGRQYMSWISARDAARATLFALDNESLAGPANAVAPEPVTNARFTRTLGRVLKRPTLLPLPAFMARMLLGEMADELLLASTRVVPDTLLANGFAFEDPTLEESLQRILT